MRSKNYQRHYRSKAWRWENSRYLWLPTLRFLSWFQVSNFILKCERVQSPFDIHFPHLKLCLYLLGSFMTFHEKISCSVMTFWGMLSHNFRVVEWKVFTQMWSKHIMKRIGVFVWNVHWTCHSHVKKNGLLYGCLS